jgi:4a-hydroxytetrahydrobiopterin dehydratase
MDTRPLTPQEINRLPEQLPDWSNIEVDGVRRLQRVYAISSVATARTFTQLLAEMASSAKHHPAVLTQLGEITVAWWTMENNTISHLDVTMAEKTDRLFAAITTSLR